ncbi:hypothetical protein PROFUN_17148, partial [Planoprotostelium fungivorum]
NDELVLFLRFTWGRSSDPDSYLPASRIFFLSPWDLFLNL